MYPSAQDRALSTWAASTLKVTNSLSFDLAKATDTTLALQNSGAGNANLNLGDGVLLTNGSIRLANDGTLENVAGDNSKWREL